MSGVIEESYAKAISQIAEEKIQKAKKAKKQEGLDEDAMVTPTALVGGGEIAAPSDGAASDLQSPDAGIKYDDVLGKCDHKHDGYLGPGCFHVPKRAGKLMRRVEILKKKKGHKNPYADKMKIVSGTESKQKGA